MRLGKYWGLPMMGHCTGAVQSMETEGTWSSHLMQNFLNLGEENTNEVTVLGNKPGDYLAGGAMFDAVDCIIVGPQNSTPPSQI